MSLIIAAAQSASAAGDVPGNVARHLRFATIAAELGVQLLVFPELSLTGYELGLARAHVLCPDSPELHPLRELAARARMIVVAGAPVANQRGDLHIAALAIHPDGSVVTHTKVHVHESERGVFTAGPGGPTLRIDDATVAMAICRDASFPQHAADARARSANVYAASVMIDDAGYVRKVPLLETYAREHGMAVLMANYSGTTGGEASAGKSAIWSEDGRPVAASADAEEALVAGVKNNGAWSGFVLPVPMPQAIAG